MPTDARVFGFGNGWERRAVVNARRVVLPAGEGTRIVTAPYFLATKLEAFAGRGAGDYLASPDLEDIITLIDGRPEIVAEVLRVEVDLRLYLTERFSALLVTRPFPEALPSHLPPDAASQGRLPIILERLGLLAQRQP